MSRPAAGPVGAAGRGRAHYFACLCMPGRTCLPVTRPAAAFQVQQAAIDAVLQTLTTAHMSAGAGEGGTSWWGQLRPLEQQESLSRAIPQRPSRQSHTQSRWCKVGLLQQQHAAILANLGPGTRQLAHAVQDVQAVQVGHG